jgi:gliding motility-associated-like protein
VPEAKLCTGNPFQIQNHSSGKDLDYSFKIDSLSYDSIPLNIVISDTGIHYITLKVRNRFGCEDSITKQVSVLAAPVASFSVENIDTGCNEMNVYFKNTSTGATVYKWDFGDGASSSSLSPVHRFSREDTFKVRLMASNNLCEDTSTMIIKAVFLPAPDVDFRLLSDTSACAPLRLVMVPEVSDYYIIYFGDGSTLVEAKDTITHTYSQPGSYRLTMHAYSAKACEAEKSILITAWDTQKEECKPEEFHLYVPNVFTPNFDVVNDDFHVFGTAIKTFHIEIYNRLGVRVYQSDDYKAAWDTQDMAAGVYVYYIRASGPSGKEIIKKGNITVLK